MARHEEARISCDLDANPSGSLHFRWLFNSSAGVIELPASTWTAEGSRSVARYLPSSDLDFGSLLCSASNSIGQQAVPCLYHVIPAGESLIPPSLSILFSPVCFERERYLRPASPTLGQQLEFQLQGSATRRRALSSESIVNGVVVDTREKLGYWN